jgi:hypothetical protein
MVNRTRGWFGLERGVVEDGVVVVEEEEDGVGSWRGAG